MAAWMVISALLGLGFWSLVVGVAAFVGCVSMVSSNAMAVILDELLPIWRERHLRWQEPARFGIGAIVGALLSLATFNSAWPMIWSIATLCNQLHSLLSVRQSAEKTVIYCTTRKL